MKKSAPLFSLKSLIAGIAVMSISSFSFAEYNSNDTGRDYQPTYSETKRHFPSREEGDVKRKVSHHSKEDQRRQHQRIKRYIDSLPEAERASIKAEFKAIREDRLANERRLDALKNRLEKHKGRMGVQMDREKKSGHFNRHGDSEKRCFEHDANRCDKRREQKNENFRHDDYREKSKNHDSGRYND